MSCPRTAQNRFGRLAVAAVVCMFATGARPAEAQEGATLFDKLVAQLPPAPHEELFGGRIQRTVSLLNDSSPERRYPVTILVYGQSITENLKRANLDQALKEKFPYADITFLNRSISGFSASQLVRSAANDIYPLYPDLVILHDYGAGLIEFERILQNIRRYTTAEIMVCSGHPKCAMRRERLVFRRASERETECQGGCPTFAPRISSFAPVSGSSAGSFGWDSLSTPPGTSTLLCRSRDGWRAPVRLT